jgi:hypothetical protein
MSENEFERQARRLVRLHKQIAELTEEYDRLRESVRTAMELTDTQSVDVDDHRIVRVRQTHVRPKPGTEQTLIDILRKHDRLDGTIAIKAGAISKLLDERDPAAIEVLPYIDFSQTDFISVRRIS